MPDIPKPSGINNRWAENGLKSEPDVSKIDLGWEIEKPPYQVQNWLDNKQDNFNAHVNQHGIPYWDNETEYQAGKSYVVDPISGIVYRCIVTNVNQPVSNATYWDIAFSPYEAMVPTGSTQMFAGTTAPRGWLIADGSAVSRTTYAALFSVIGTTYGVGDGSTTFNLPDLRGVVVRGVDRGRGLDSSRVQGSYQGDLFASHNHPTTVTIQQGGAHTHPVSGTASSAGPVGDFAGSLNGQSSLATGSFSYISRLQGKTRGSDWGENFNARYRLDGNHTHIVTATAASAGEHTHPATASSQSIGGTETRMKNIALLGIIKY